jgi:hypothetical protein
MSWDYLHLKLINYKFNYFILHKNRQAMHPCISEEYYITIFLPNLSAKKPLNNAPKNMPKLKKN